jgi:hypothetical protein
MVQNPDASCRRGGLEQIATDCITRFPAADVAAMLIFMVG